MVINMSKVVWSDNTLQNERRTGPSYKYLIYSLGHIRLVDRTAGTSANQNTGHDTVTTWFKLNINLHPSTSASWEWICVWLGGLDADHNTSWSGLLFINITTYERHYNTRWSWLRVSQLCREFPCQPRLFRFPDDMSSPYQLLYPRWMKPLDEVVVQTFIISEYNNNCRSFRTFV